MDTEAGYASSLNTDIDGGGSMKYLDEDPVVEVHRIRVELLEEYGGIEGLHKHMAEDLPRLIKEGWKFLTPEEAATLRKRREMARAQ
jgi:hypothetical protein